MFAVAYMGRKRRGAALSNAFALPTKAVDESSESIGKTSFSAHIRHGEHGAPVQDLWL
jgi:hypothetical protein